MPPPDIPKYITKVYIQNTVNKEVSCKEYSIIVHHKSHLNISESIKKGKIIYLIHFKSSNIKLKGTLTYESLLVLIIKLH